MIETAIQARERARQYASRWLIMDFHKALKTGLGAERLQMHTAPRQFAAVALLSVVALALVELREHSRQQPGAPAETPGLSVRYLRVLRSQHARPIQIVRGVFYALAGLGGHRGHVGNGPRGWQRRSGLEWFACATSSRAYNWLPIYRWTSNKKAPDFRPALSRSRFG